LPGHLAPGPSETHGWCALPSVRPFTAFPPLRRPLLTSRSAASSATSPFRTSDEISPGTSPDLPCTAAGSTPPDRWVPELGGPWPARPGRLRLVSDSCSPARRFVPRFRQRRPHDRRLAGSLGFLHPRSRRTCTSSSVPMLGAQTERPPKVTLRRPFAHTGFMSGRKGRLTPRETAGRGRAVWV
jgi:hypothetical protein